MEQAIKDTLGMGVLLWLGGYLASMAVYFSPLDYTLFGRVVLVLYIPCVIQVTAWYFSGRDLPLWYYAATGIAWSLAAVVLDYPFIVLRFGAYGYYTPDVYLYYAIMFLVPVMIGIFFCRPGAGLKSP